LPSEPAKPRTDHTHAAFPLTRWTLVGRLRGTEAESARALEDLCRHYWFPIYATLRHGGRTAHDAEDLTQGFFAALMADRTFFAAQPERGRLRNFLLGALKRFLADEARHRLAQKRGGGATMLSIEWERAEQRYLAEPMDERDPEKIYLSAWAHSLLERVRAKVRAGFAGRETEYAALAPFIEGEENGIPFRELAARLGQSESGARVTVFRLRQRFRELLTEAVRQTVETPAEVEEELAWLLGVLRERAGA
jgi:RNA polymerase sigma-70 factor (ECF subfamily)